MPSLPELLLGIGGIGIALIATALAVKVPFLPQSLADADANRITRLSPRKRNSNGQD